MMPTAQQAMTTMTNKTATIPPTIIGTGLVGVCFPDVTVCGCEEVSVVFGGWDVCGSSDASFDEVSGVFVVVIAGGPVILSVESMVPTVLLRLSFPVIVTASWMLKSVE